MFPIENRGRLITKKELNQNIWGGRIVSDSALSSRIKIARHALGDNGRKQKFIRTIHKRGFSFIGEVEDKACNKSGSIRADQEGINGKSTSSVFDGMPSSATDETRPAIAVLPFSSSGGDPEQDYLATGITEDIVTTLSKISKLIVVTYSTISPQNPVDIKQVGRELEVGYILEGSVRSDGNRLRMSAHLIDVGNCHHIWAERYERKNMDLFNLQDEVSKEVVSALQVELTEGDPALFASRGTANIEAWKLTFEGEASVLEHRKDSV